MITVQSPNFSSLFSRAIKWQSLLSQFVSLQLQGGLGADVARKAKVDKGRGENRLSGGTEIKKSRLVCGAVLLVHYRHGESGNYMYIESCRSRARLAGPNLEYSRRRLIHSGVFYVIFFLHSPHPLPPPRSFFIGSLNTRHFNAGPFSSQSFCRFRTASLRCYACDDN